MYIRIIHRRKGEVSKDLSDDLVPRVALGFLPLLLRGAASGRQSLSVLDNDTPTQGSSFSSY